MDFNSIQKSYPQLCRHTQTTFSWSEEMADAAASMAGLSVKNEGNDGLHPRTHWIARLGSINAGTTLTREKYANNLGHLPHSSGKIAIPKKDPHVRSVNKYKDCC